MNPRFLLVLFLTAVFVAACGDAPDTESASPAPESTAAQPEATSQDFAFATVTVGGTVSRLPSGDPAAGSLVRVKEYPIETTTAADGSFSLQLIVGSAEVVSVHAARRQAAPAHHPSGIALIDTAQSSHSPTLRMVDGSYRSLLIEPVGKELSYAVDLNASEQLAGNFADQLLFSSSVPEMPFRFTDLDEDGAVDPGEVLQIGYLPGFVTARAVAINDAGQVTGFTRGTFGAYHGWLFTDADEDNEVDDGEVVDLGQLGPGQSVFPPPSARSATSPVMPEMRIITAACSCTPTVPSPPSPRPASRRRWGSTATTSWSAMPASSTADRDWPPSPCRRPLTA